MCKAQLCVTVYITYELLYPDYLYMMGMTYTDSNIWSKTLHMGTYST